MSCSPVITEIQERFLPAPWSMDFFLLTILPPFCKIKQGKNPFFTFLQISAPGSPVDHGLFLNVFILCKGGLSWHVCFLKS